jgi:hypothetical protein
VDKNITKFLRVMSEIDEERTLIVRHQTNEGGWRRRWCEGNACGETELSSMRPELAIGN